MKSTVTFKQFFRENMTVDSALGGSEGQYAENDARIPFSGPVLTRAGKLTRKRKKKRKSFRKK